MDFGLEPFLEKAVMKRAGYSFLFIKQYKEIESDRSAVFSIVGLVLRLRGRGRVELQRSTGFSHFGVERI